MFRKFLIVIMISFICAPAAAKKTITKPSERAVYHNNQGIEALSRGDTDRAEFEFMTAAELSPQYAEAWSNLGIIYKGRGDYDKAIEMFTKAKKVDKNYGPAYIHLGTVFIAQGRYESAISIIKKGLKKHTTSSDGYYNLGLAYFKQWQQTKKDKDIKGAIKALKKSTELDPALTPAHNLLSKIYKITGDAELVVVRERLALGDAPESVEGWVKLGQTYMSQNDYERARNCFQKALEINPSSAPAHIALGQYFMVKDEINLAVNEFNAATLVDPLSEHAWYYYGTALLREGEKTKQSTYFKKSVAALSKAKDLNPSFAQASYNLGLAYLRQKDTSSAIREWEHTIKIGPKFAPAYYNLGTAYQLVGRTNEALATLCKFLNVAGDDYPAEKGAAERIIKERKFKCK